MAGIQEPLDIHGNVATNLPLDAKKAGFTQLAFNRGGTSDARVARVSAEGELRIAHTTRLFDCDFNGAAAGALINNQWNQQSTTMSGTLNSGFLRFNAGSSSAANVGFSINTWRTFCLREHMNLKLSALIRHTNGSVANKIFEFGFGYYDVAAQQSAAVNEFVGFRWNALGGLQAVLAYSTGAAPVEVVANINVGIPYSDNVVRSYEIVVGEEGADFWVDGEMVVSLKAQPDAAGLWKSATHPVMMRQYHIGSAPPATPVFEVGSVGVSSIGPSADEDRNVLQVAMGRHALRGQQGIQAASGSLSAVPASGTAPGALVASNTVSGLVGLGGQGRVTLTGITATVHTELIMNSFQNPVFPETAGVANNARQLVITDVFIRNPIVSAALAGGGFTIDWFLAFGSTALSLATTDGAGGANIGSKSPARMPLNLMDTFAAAAALGTVSTRNGDGSIALSTPIVLAPGEFIHVGARSLFVAAAVTAGAIDIGIGFNGYWM